MLMQANKVEYYVLNCDCSIYTDCSEQVLQGWYHVAITQFIIHNIYYVLYIPTNSNSINTQHTDIFSFGNESKNNLIIVETSLNSLVVCTNKLMYPTNELLQILILECSKSFQEEIFNQSSY